MGTQTKFVVGQVVRSTVNAQGMRAGHAYRVVDISTLSTAFGGFTTYTLEALADEKMGVGAKRLAVGNGHLILTAEEQAEHDCDKCGDTVATSEPVGPRFVCDECVAPAPAPVRQRLAPSKTLAEIFARAAAESKVAGQPAPTATLLQVANEYGLIWDGSSFVPLEETSACQLVGHCVLQAGHNGPCREMFASARGSR